MHAHSGGVGGGGVAGVVALVRRACLLDEQAARRDGSLLRDEADASPGRVEVYDLENTESVRWVALAGCTIFYVFCRAGVAEIKSQEKETFWNK